MRIRDIKMIFKDITPKNPIIVDTTMSDLIKIQMILISHHKTKFE